MIRLGKFTKNFSFLLKSSKFPAFFGVNQTPFNPKAANFSISQFSYKSLRYFSSIESNYDKGARYYKEGNFTEAIKCLEKNLQQSKEDSPESLVKTYQMLGLSHYSLGKLEQALEYLQNALNLSINSTTVDHQKTSECYSYLGLVYLQMSMNDEAIEYLKQALSISLSSKDDKDSVNTATIYKHLGVAYHRAGQYEPSLEYYEKALNLYVDLLGHENEYCSATLEALSRVYNDLDMTAEAMDCLNKALAIEEALNDCTSLTAAIIYLRKAIILGKLQEPEEGLQYGNKSLEMLYELVGEKHPETANCFSALSSLYQQQNNYEKALEYANLALKINLDTYGDKHPVVAVIYHNLGNIYAAMGKENDALEILQKCREIELEAYGEDHPDIAMTYFTIGTLLANLGRHDEGIQYYKKGIDIFKKFNDENDPRLIAEYQNLGMIYNMKGDSKGALEYYTKAIEALEEDEESYQENFPVVVELYELIGKIHEQDPNSAIKYYEQVIENMKNSEWVDEELIKHFEQKIQDLRK